jgi:two-component system phosphate regulon response regulator PhoB
VILKVRNLEGLVKNNNNEKFMTHKILICEDDKFIASSISEYLQALDYKTSTVNDGEEAIKEFNSFKPDLILLDVMMPKLNGIEVIKIIRDKSRTPIIFLTAKISVDEKILGLELGADDYIGKPFSMRELTLRVASLLKRSHLIESKDNILLGILEIDLSAHRVLIDEAQINLTAKEFDLLLHLARHNGKVQTRDYLLQQIWGYSSDVTTRTVDTHIKRLRSKIGILGQHIETVRSVGYRFDYNPLA